MHRGWAKEEIYTIYCTCHRLRENNLSKIVDKKVVGGWVRHYLLLVNICKYWLNWTTPKSAGNEIYKLNLENKDHIYSSHNPFNQSFWVKIRQFQLCFRVESRSFWVHFFTSGGASLSFSGQVPPRANTKLKLCVLYKRLINNCTIEITPRK